ncbi:hypothetical protein K0M31_014205, partial [Melipona bicolor]
HKNAPEKKKIQICINFAQKFSHFSGNGTLGIGDLSIDKVSSSDSLLTLMESISQVSVCFIHELELANYYRRFTTLDDRIIGSAKRDVDNSDHDSFRSDRDQIYRAHDLRHCIRETLRLDTYDFRLLIADMTNSDPVGLDMNDPNVTQSSRD